MQILTFANHKGGVGKSTSALNVAHELTELGHRVLLVDCDPQSNLTMSFPEGQLLSDARNLGGLLSRTAPAAALVHRVGERLWLIAATRQLEYLERVLGSDPAYQFLLRDALAPIAAQFEYCVIDTRPALSALTFSALTASTAIFIPVQPEYYGYAGLQTLLEACATVRQHFNPALQIGGVFFTKYARTYRRKLHHSLVEIMEHDPALGGCVMQVSIREGVAVAEAQIQQRPLQQWAPTSKPRQDYQRLTQEILTILPHA